MARDAPIKHGRIGGLEHDLLHGHIPDDSLDDVGAPSLDILGDALALDHHPLDAGVDDDEDGDFEQVSGGAQGRAKIRIVTMVARRGINQEC